MNQQCKVCGEPAAGFHFGAFTCEGCKSFFGRSYNNINSITECKNNGECVINKKNRTACKACRLRKCLVVGMSKSGSRYGRRSNWFKIHCLLQEQQQAQQQASTGVGGGGGGGNGGGGGTNNHSTKPPQRTSPPHHHHHHPSLGLSLLNQQFPPPLLHLPKTKEELMLLGLDDYKHATSPSVSSPESHNSDSSVEVSDARRVPIFPGFLPHAFLPPPNLLFPPGYPHLYPGLLQPVNNNNGLVRNHNHTPTHSPGVEAFSKRVFLDAVLQSQRTPTPDRPPTPEEPRTTTDAPVEEPQDDPIDLSMKTMSDRASSAASSLASDRSDAITERGSEEDADEESDCDSVRELKRIKLIRPTPVDLTSKV